MDKDEDEIMIWDIRYIFAFGYMLGVLTTLLAILIGGYNVY